MIRTILGFLLVLFLANCREKVKSKSPISPNEREAVSENAKSIGWKQVSYKDNTEPIERHEAAFVRVGQKFYLLGGRDVRAVSIFDTKTQKWSTGPKPPLELHHFQPVVIEDKIYIIGALTGGWPEETPTTHIYIYDTTYDSWSQSDEIPKNRRRGSTGNVLYDGKVYIACGIKKGHIGDHKNWLDSYDPKTGEWKALASAPRARDHFQAVLVNDKIVAAAGRNTGIVPDDPFGGTIAEVDIYDIANDSWSTLPTEIPTKRAGNAGILFGDQVLIAGGESSVQEKAHAEVEALNMTTGEWKSLPDLIEGRHGTGLLEYRDALFIASGCGNRGGSPELRTMEKYEH